MGRLLLYTDLSPSWPWLFSTIHANRGFLAENNIELGPLTSNPYNSIPFHSPFWCIMPKGGGVTSQHLELLKALVHQLESGRDVLLFSRWVQPDRHQSMVSLFRKYFNLTQHDVEVLFILGRPACVLEQRYREAIPFLSEKKGRQLVEWLTSLPSLIKYNRQAWGADKVTLLADTSVSPAACAQEDLAQRLFSWLGCSRWRHLEHLPRHPLFLSSLTARRLNQALEVRENAWPRLDERGIMDSLLSLDCRWGSEPVSPNSIRDALNKNGEDSLRELEEMLALKNCSLECPDWLAEQPEADMDVPLPEECLQRFAAALSLEVCHTLRQRFNNDAALLTADQKVFSKVLSSVTSENGMVIGEPVPPVELTVLTMTYNHEKYIGECMDSVLAQKTSFPVRHIVLDHCSADDTPNIVSAYAKKYPSIQPVLLSSRRPSENVMGLFLRCRTKYAALCDGDDYFIEPLKLQKQIDFLESHPRCTLCFHPVAMVFEDGQQPAIFPPIKMLPRGIREEYHLADLFKGNMIQTNTVVYRWRFQEGLPAWFRPDLCPGDWYWHLLHAEQGRIGFLSDIMSVYRRHGTASYKDSFINPLEHRRIHGLAELKTYWVVNEHFSGRYFRSLAMLANGVFSHFLKIYAEEGDRSLLDQASRDFPAFAKQFFLSLKIFPRLKIFNASPEKTEE